MQNNNNIEKDAFGEMMRNRLENVQAPLDEGLWTDIEKRMQKKRRVIPFWFWTTLGGVAAIAFIVLTLRPFGNFTPDNKEDIETLSQNNSIQPSASNTTDKTNNNNTLKNSNPVQIPIKNNKTLSENTIHSSSKKTDHAKNIINTDKMVNGTLEEKENLTGNIVSEIKKNDVAINSNNDKEIAKVDITNQSDNNIVLKDQPETKKYDQLNDLQAENERVYTSPKHLSDEITLAAAFGSGSGSEFSSSGFINNAPMRAKIVDVETVYTNIMSASDFSSITHLPPVSFGIKINKEFAKDWSVESGLVYTYMSSLYKDVISQNVNADLNLHYLGIPVNINWNIVNKKKWNIYISGGGMIEKGLRSIYNQHTFVGSYEYTTVAKTKIEGIQLSISGATGFSYLIYNDIAFYAEPSITYYFKNNQPMSARTNQPLIVGFNAGLKFRL